MEAVLDGYGTVCSLCKKEVKRARRCDFTTIHKDGKSGRNRCSNVLCYDCRSICNGECSGHFCKGGHPLPPNHTFYAFANYSRENGVHILRGNEFKNCTGM